MAQRSGENVVTAAGDAFGTTVGNEKIGLYSNDEVRGFNPVTAGNVRLDGLYFDLQGNINSRAVTGNTIRVGINALGYPFSSPSGIVDYTLRSSGNDSTGSVALQLGPFSTHYADVDAQLKLIEDRASIAAGFGLRRQENSPGAANEAINWFVSPRWTPNGRVELRSFWAANRMTRGEDAQPTVFVAGTYLPPSVDFGDLSQAWTDSHRRLDSYGALGTMKLGAATTLRGGLFRSLFTTTRSFSDYFLNTTAQGIGTHVVVGFPEQRRASLSGEARMTSRLADGPRTHVIDMIVRGRSSSNLYGGSNTARFADQDIARFTAFGEPNYVFTERSQDKVRQITRGIGYELRWRNLGEISVGVQNTRYRKNIQRPLSAPATSHSSPLLPSAAMRVSLNRRLSVYATYTKGLEENGAAPDVATNRGEPLPALVTSQREIGARYLLTSKLTLIAGAFDLRRPYFALDSKGLFGQAGALRNPGVELSLAGQIVDGLTVVGGGVLMRPRVTAEAVRLGQLGDRPVGVTSKLARLNLDYRMPFLPPVSVDVGAVWTGAIAATRLRDPTSGQQINVPARATIDIGARYRFALFSLPSALRVQLQNATNAGGWRVTTAGGFQRYEPRRAWAAITSDF